MGVELLLRLAWTRWPRLRFSISSSFVVAGRALLCLTAVLLAVMPLTEHFLVFDGFLHGGQDFELSLLAVLALLCLVLLLGHGGACAIAAFLVLVHTLFDAVGHGLGLGARSRSTPDASLLLDWPSISSASPAFAQPLRI